MYNFASILFYGECNAHCPTCIGRLPEFSKLTDNLSRFPLPGMGMFCNEIKSIGTDYISFSGISADPQQYKHEDRLIKYIRRNFPRLIISLHTNGLLALQKMTQFRSYDRVTLTFPSFNKDIYKSMMGVPQINLERVVRESGIPIKLSMLLTEDTKNDIDVYIKNAEKLGIRRVVIRRLSRSENRIRVFVGVEPKKYVYDNPVYDINGVEVTVWNYDISTVNGLYLFPDGSIRGSFLKEKN